MKSRIAINGDEFRSGFLDDATFSRSVELFNEHGALWLENAVNRELIPEIAAAYTARYVALGKSKLNRHHATVGHSRFMVTVEVEPPFDSPQLFANPLVMPVIRRLLGADCRISSYGSVVTFPGADQQPVHLDYPPLFESEATCAALPPYALTLVIPLVDVDESTGSTAIWEGSHRAKGSRDQLAQLMESPSLAGSVHPLPRMGDIYLMDYRTIHAGMANESEQSRPILYIVYSRRWFRDAYNFTDQPPVIISGQKYESLPAEQRQLFEGHPDRAA